MRFDSLQIGVSDLAQAAAQYRLLLGDEGAASAGRHRFQFQRGAAELVSAPPGLRSLTFAPEGDEDSGWPREPEAYHGIEVVIGRKVEPRPSAGSRDRVQAIDHVVIQSPDLDRSIALWRDRLGIRLALDREFPQRGLRLLFFRSGGVTLEFSGALGARAGSSAPDRLWGVAYQVADLDACRARLLAAGVAVGETRPGNKKGTFVATAKSHALGVPTLLLQPVDSPEAGR